MGKELAVVMETDYGWVRHGLMDNWGECHPPPGFTVSRQQAPLEPFVPASVWAVHLCLPPRDITSWQCDCQFMSVSEGSG